MRRGEPRAAAEGPECQERADGGTRRLPAATRRVSRRRRREGQPGPPVAAAESGRAAFYGEPRRPAATRGGGAGGPRAREQRAAAAAAASSAPAPPPAPRKSPPTTGAPGSARGKARDSPKPLRCEGLKQPSQSFLWIKKYIYRIFFFLGRRKGEEDQRGSARKKGGCNSWIRFFSTPETSRSTL